MARKRAMTIQVIEIHGAADAEQFYWTVLGRYSSCWLREPDHSDNSATTGRRGISTDETAASNVSDRADGLGAGDRVDGRLVSGGGPGSASVVEAD